MQFTKLTLRWFGGEATEGAAETAESDAKQTAEPTETQGCTGRPPEDGAGRGGPLGAGGGGSETDLSVFLAGGRHAHR